MMKKLRNSMLFGLLLCLLTALAGCGGNGKTAVQPLPERNQLPADGIVTQEQMEAIAGQEGTYEFYAADKDSGIKYSWFYDGSKIQNAAEQRLKVQFTQDQVGKVKKLADNATVGLGLKLENMTPAAPLKLKLTLTETWDADAVILCKLVDGKPVQMAATEIETVTTGEKDKTTLTFSVPEVGDTYYLVGGRTKAAAADAAGGGETGQDSQDTQDGKNSRNSQNGQSHSGSQSGQNNIDSREGQNDGSGQSGQQTDTAEDRSVHTCTIAIDCISLAEHMDKLRNKEKAAFVPKDGWLLYTSEIEYTPGESVYDVLRRACKRAGYQMEASYTPGYGSYYVEGINQLYEFDAGELSGWMYSVNGWYPNYGCSSYEVKDGDKIRFRYTCDLGADIGGHNVVR